MTYLAVQIRKLLLDMARAWHPPDDDWERGHGHMLYLLARDLEIEFPDEFPGLEREIVQESR